MSWMNMLSGWQWLVMAVIPPLVVMLYLLKLRRTPVQVPSTYLWRRTIEDLHVNSIWQRLRQNLLLWLQLLVLGIVALACLRPGIRDEQTIAQRSIFLIDNSASMQATDVAGMTRLEAAKERAMQMVDGMDRSDVAMVIAFSDRADVRQGYSSDKRRLKAAIQSIGPTSRTTDLIEALRTASGLANPGRTSQIQDVNDIQVAEAVPAHVYLLSDGGFATPPIDLGNLTAEYIPIGSVQPQNIAILAFTCQRNEEKPGQVEAYARLQNFGSQPMRADAELLLDGQLIDAEQVQLDGGQAQGLSFEIADLQAGQLELRLQADDHLAVDNVAYAALTPARQLEVVLVSNGNTALRAALATPLAMAAAHVREIRPDELDNEEMQRLSASGNVDLFIYDNCAPTTMPEANTLFLGTCPPGSDWKASEPQGPIFVIDVNRGHPLLQYVDLSALLIAEGISFQLPVGAAELARSDDGVLMAVAPRDAFQDAVVGLKLQQNNTNWVNRRSFPIFVLNCLDYLGGAASSAGAKSFRPGQQAVMHLSSRFDQLTIEDPSGKQTPIGRNSSAQIAYSNTDTLGIYRVQSTAPERTLQMFSVNLFSDTESNIQPAADIRIGLQEVETRTAAATVVRAEYWRWLLAAGLIILLLEWYLYTRRIAV
ncbi:MAG: BatA and WFA domain-containing protein [Pirellulaceae bacterium]|nr:BatA and WFA domain-containing protein [Pirellulaceae bacterium]